MFDKNQLQKELEFQFALSGGPGGQHVNKTETKVIITWDLEASGLFNEAQKQRIKTKLEKRINSEGQLKLSVAKSRSQLQNKKLAVSMLENLLSKALQKPKKRIKTKPSRSSKLKRLQKKKQHSDKKQLRKKPKL
ncbi:alternative ribosome rescue aminoacyl-tRNA hydrolase ArfB [Psychroflexus montanilacus]|uniref:alternative ribosome rescue aminoacyl-tRNA hydrolase ArfB n=1 Tax=Psychroflexus montanilacus TaxID=2873598 RepID=UPI001CCB5C3E|nr:alternative ribosome rescue aminoacyl-tRNA hydrolase ArfB [Psychroflexus montanilacus]MBZ9652394.1 aminoacyl-tRNA hydrolase [Psychroflexus montanilacus]